MTSYAKMDSPFGPLVLVEDDGGLAGLYLTQDTHVPDRVRLGERDDDALPAVREQLQAYFVRDLTQFDVPLATRGTPFQERVWAALRDIPYGTTCSYVELARAVGSPGASRAVGGANGRNPICIIVPCHRVVGADGSLSGYAGGVERKRALLAFESGQVVGSQVPATQDDLWAAQH